MKNSKGMFWLKATLIGVGVAGAFGLLLKNLQPQSTNVANGNTSGITSETATTTSESGQKTLYEVQSVVDGDTIRIIYEGKETSVRLIGVNTPETVDPRTTVECFGKEASDYLKGLLTGKTVEIEPDSSQTDRDKYDRLLRYVYLDGEDVGLKILNGGYGHEYTYNIPYAKQSAYKAAEQSANNNKKGLWANGVCENASGTTSSGSSSSSSDTTNTQPATPTTTTPTAPATTTTTPAASSSNCNIKGNISSNGKIYHMPGQKYYSTTKIDTSKGERWFCSEAEAQAARWRKSKV